MVRSKGLELPNFYLIHLSALSMYMPTAFDGSTRVNSAATKNIGHGLANESLKIESEVKPTIKEFSNVVLIPYAPK